MGTIPSRDELASHAFSNADGCIIADYGDGGVVAADSPASLYVQCGSVRCIIERLSYTYAAKLVGPIAVPSGGSAGDLRRIDVVQITAGVGWTIKQGDEDATPVEPDLDAHSIKAYTIHCRNGMGSVVNSDDSSNGYLGDGRVFG